MGVIPEDSFGQVFDADGIIRERRESKFALGLDIGQSIDQYGMSFV